MEETIDLLGKIITNILTVLYEPFGFSLLLSFLAMFFYLYAYEPTAAGKGWKSAIVTWYQKFKESVFFRKMFLLVFVTSMILFRTLLNRNLWLNPLSNVMGGWGIWETVNGEQKLTTECIENVIMMVPLTSMVIWTFQEKVGSSWKKILWYSGKIAFIFSISMETIDPFNIIYQTAEDGLGDTVKPRLIEADADLERVLVIDDRDTPLTLADERIARAIRENNARLVIIDPVQAFLGADVDMNRANEVRPIFRSLGDIAQATGCAIVLIGHLNKAAGTQSTYRGLGSIDITAAVRSLLFIGKLKDSPTTRVLIHEKSSLAPPGQSLAFSLGDEKGFEWIGAYDITADELLAGTDTAKTESKTAQAQMLILELLADGKRMPSAELEKTVNERGISSRTMRTAKSRIGDRLVTEKDGTAWVCYLRD